MYVVTYLSGQESAAEDGHAWIRLESNSGQVTTVSLWGNRGDQEFWKNLEVPFGYGTAYKVTNITNAQYDMIAKYNGDASNINWTIFNTCAGYSAGLWNYVTGDALSARTWYGTTTPYQLQQSIIGSNGQIHPANGSTSSSTP